MHIVVCVKQVPDTTEIKIDPKTNTLIREGVPSVVNPFDANAIEEALKLREKFAGKVTVISMGPPQAKEALRKTVSLGADRTILLSAREFAGADTLATSYTLTKAIEKIREEEDVDLILCGKQAIDGDTGQVGPGIATRLKWSQLTYVLKIEDVDFNRGEIQVQRKVGGRAETVRSKLPALVTVLKEMNRPRYPTLRNRLRAKECEPEIWDQSSLNADPGKIGMSGSPTSVKQVFTPPPRTLAERTIVDAADMEKSVSTVVEKIIPFIPTKK